MRTNSANIRISIVRHRRNAETVVQNTLTMEAEPAALYMLAPAADPVVRPIIGQNVAELQLSIPAHGRAGGGCG
jgi:hypothetical protein